MPYLNRYQIQGVVEFDRDVQVIKNFGMLKPFYTMTDILYTPKEHMFLVKYGTYVQATA